MYGVGLLIMKKNFIQDNIEVSILCLTYNHEEYISDALKSFVSQKTNFNFEIIIHDDASTDRTYELIDSYAEMYDNIVCIRQKVNKYYDEDLFVNYINGLIRGNYIALCDGDDYWTDPGKLQMMYDNLKKNPNCSCGVHRVNCFNGDGTLNSRTIPEDYYGIKGDGIIKAKDVAKMLFINKGYPFHTSSYFFKKNVFTNAQYMNWTKVGRDIDFIKNAILFGDVIYIDKVMSLRRLDTFSGWNNRMNSKKKWDLLLMNDIISNEKYDAFSGYRFHNEISHYILNSCMYLLNDYPLFAQKQMKYVGNKIGIYNHIRKDLIRFCPRLLSLGLKIKEKIIG